MQYIVTATIQSNDRSNPPADVTWYRGDNLAVALSAMAAAAVQTDDLRDTDIPESMRYRTLAVNLAMVES